MLLLGINKGLRGSRPEISVLFELQELLQQDDCGTVGGPGAALPDGGQNKGVVCGRGVDPRRRAKPRCLACAGVRVAHGRFGVPVDADAAKTDRLCDDAKRDRVDGAVEGAPVCRKAIQVLAGTAALYGLACVMDNAAIARRDLQRDAQHVPDALQLFHKLRVDHLGFTLFALALELVAGKIFGQRGGVPALICYDAHKISPFHRKS